MSYFTVFATVLLLAYSHYCPSVLCLIFAFVSYVKQAFSVAWTADDYKKAKNSSLSVNPRLAQFWQFQMPK